MKIEFLIEQGIRNNEKIITINAIKMLARSGLPREYIDEGESVSMYKDIVYHTDKDSNRMEGFMQVGDWYYEDCFWDKIGIVKICAKRLRNINRNCKKSLMGTNWSLVKREITI